MENNGSRAVFTNRLTTLLVASGSAVGLGNIWRFPYLVGEGGGAAFIILYLLAVVFIGHPIMLSEFVVGSSTRKNVVGAYGAKSPKWRLLGFNGVMVVFLISCFFYVVAGWTLYYFISAVSGEFVGMSQAAEYTGFFQSFVSDPYIPIIYTIVFITLNHFVAIRGVKRGLEQVSKFMMPLLFVLLIALSITVLFMPGSGEGLRYLFVPDFSVVTPRVVLSAVTQVFFSLSLGMGILTTYGSYFKEGTDIRKTATQLSFIDTGVALLASLIILPAVFSVGVEPTSGPSLVFITLPSVFNTLPMSALVSSVFFLLLFIAALTSTISMHEVIVTYLVEERHLSRTTAVTAASLSISIFAILVCLSFNVLSDFSLFGLGLFDLLDTLSSNIMIPLGGIFTAIYVGWVLERTLVKRALSNSSRYNDLIVDSNIILLRYICPVVIFIIFLDGLSLI